MCKTIVSKGVVFSRGDLRFILALRIVLPVIAKALLNRTDKYSGACVLIARAIAKIFQRDTKPLLTKQAEKLRVLTRLHRY